jgi:uncharacterized repeat protein (TIGR01451 family)
MIKTASPALLYIVSRHLPTNIKKKKMKKIFQAINNCLLSCIAILTTLTVSAQSTGSCTMLDNPIGASLTSSKGSPLTSIKSGLDFNVNLTLPGQSGCNGNYQVIINTSNNLMQGATAPVYPYPFVSTSNPNEYKNGPTLPTGSGGIGINIPFKFKPGTTCNNETGEFRITILLSCNGEPIVYRCSLKLSLKAEAENYWVVEKKWVFGNLSGGGIYWDIIITNTNANPGIGDLNIVSGSITDILTPGEKIISVSSNAVSVTGLNTKSASWKTGYILSTTQPVVYRVITYSCESAGTVVKNCVNYDFCLGRESSNIVNLSASKNEIAILEEQKNPEIKKLPPSGNSGPIGPAPIICCNRPKGQACASVTLVGAANTSANFSKILNYGSNLNYAKDCEGEYLITVSNNGDVPLTDLVIGDVFPEGITVTKIQVNGNGMYYDIVSPVNLLNQNSSTITGAWVNPNSFEMRTTPTSDPLLQGSITIRIRFTITAAATKTIHNCATLNYSGTYNGWGTWCTVPLPPPSKNKTETACRDFTVEQPKFIPGIIKCITNGQQTFSVGDLIPFRIVISNHGQATFNGTLSDFLGSPQNLSIEGSVRYSYGKAGFNPYRTTPNCISAFSYPSTSPPSWLKIIQQTPNNLNYDLKDMPGNCKLDEAFYLVIEFEAKVLPQSFGDYINTAHLNTLNADANYNIMRDAKIIVQKEVSTQFADPGQPFNYRIKVLNGGSVALKNIQVTDQLPDCVTFSGKTAEKLDANGNSNTTVTGGPTIYDFPGLVLQPGESVRLTIQVTRKSNDQGKQCCNLKAKAVGTPVDANALPIYDENGPACVENRLCCDIDGMTVTFNTGVVNGSILPMFLISSGPLPVQEIEISLLDYHVVYNDPNCKPLNIKKLTGHIQPFVGYAYLKNWNCNSIPNIVGSPALQRTSPITPVNNSITWTGANPINLASATGNGSVILNFISPDIVNLPCCTGTVFYCFKVRVKDVNCNVCEKIVCGSSEIVRMLVSQWSSTELRDRYEIQLLNIQSNPGINTNDGRGFYEIMGIPNPVPDVKSKNNY